MLRERKIKLRGWFRVGCVILGCFLVVLFLLNNNVYAQGRLKVLLVGDSYTAGNGARKLDGSTDNFGPKGCYRSNSNWGQKYVNQLNELGYSVTLINRACSGSVSNDLLYDNDMEQEGLWAQTPETYGVSSTDSGDSVKSKLLSEGYCPPREVGEEYYRINILEKSQNELKFECRRYIKAQISNVDDSYDLVLMTLGGNDTQFSDIIMKCFAPIVSEPQSCRMQISDSEGVGEDSRTGSYKDNMNKIFSNLRSKLRSDAKVVLLNYPYLAKDDNYVLKDLFGGGSYEASKNVRELGRFGDEVQASLIPQQAPDKASIYYFNELKDKFAGHEPDMRDFWHNNSDKWINTFGSRLPTDWFHFNSIGHQEVANALYQDLENKVDGFPLKTKQDYDVVFVYNQSFDANLYNKDDLAIKGITIGKIRDQILSVANTARFGIIGYNLWIGSDGRTGPKTKLFQDFTPDIFQLSKSVPRFSNLLGTTTKGELKNALEAALNMKWRPGVKKLIYIIGKTRADDDIYEAGYYDSVVKKSLELDSVPISPVMSALDSGKKDLQAENLASETGGVLSQSVKVADYTPDWVSNNIETPTITSPYAWAGEGVEAKIGDHVRLDASGSYDDVGIASYQWDVDGDGVYDISTSAPVSEYVYNQAYAGLIILKVTSSSGASSMASLQAVITRDGDSIESSTDNCADDWNEDQSDADDDGIGDICDSEPGIAGYMAESDPPPTQEDVEPSPGDTADTDTNTNLNHEPSPEHAPVTIESDGASKNISYRKLDSQPQKNTENTENTVPAVLRADGKNLRKNKTPASESYNNWFAKTKRLSRDWKAVVVFGSITGIGSAMLLLNMRLFEEDD